MGPSWTVFCGSFGCDEPWEYWPYWITNDQITIARRAKLLAPTGTPGKGRTHRPWGEISMGHPCMGGVLWLPASRHVGFEASRKVN
jgi:hypothetical protein